MKGRRFPFSRASGILAILILSLALVPLCSGCAALLPALLRSEEAPAVSHTPESPAATPTVAPTPTPSPTPEPLGTRTNPLLPGQACSILTEDPGVLTAESTITLTQVLRGAEVWDLFSAANMFNSAPAAGKEYLLAQFTISCESVESDADQPVTYTQYNFRSSSSDFSVSDRPVLVYPEEYPELNLTLYAGASGSGWVCFEVDQDDPLPYAVMDSIWFLLADGIPVAPEISPDLEAFLAQAEADAQAFFVDTEVYTNYNGETYSILLTAPEGLAGALALSPDEMRPSWTNYVNVLLDYNRDAYAAFEAAGYGDIDVALILISDADANDMLFSSENGSIVYSALAPDVASTLPDAEELQPIVDWLQTAEVKGRYDGSAYQRAEIEDEELQFLATYFYYCMNGETEAALALFTEPVDSSEVERGNLDMEAYHPHTLTIRDGNITLLVEDPSGELIGFGVFYNDLAHAPQMLPELT